MSWCTLTDYLCSAVSSKISLLRQLSRYVSVDCWCTKEILSMIHLAFIRRWICYVCVWRGGGATSSTNFGRINKLQKRTAHIILCADFTTASSDMFQELSWLPVNKWLKYNKAVFTHKALNNLTPQYITELLKPISDAHTRTLRSSVSGALAVPRSRTSLFDRFYSYSAPKLWNSIPISATLSSFKENIKQIFQTTAF